MSGDCIRGLLLAKLYVVLILTTNNLRSHANGRSIVGQQLTTLLDVTCCVRLFQKRLNRWGGALIKFSEDGGISSP